MPLDQQRYVDHFVADLARFAAAVRTGPLDARIGACPGWDLRQLVAHVGHVHRWSRLCVLTGENPQVAAFVQPPADADGETWATWLEKGGERLAATLRALDPTSPTWHPFLVERVAGLWPRRQAHEITVHRYDAELAVGTPAPIDAELASDGIDEWFEVTLPRTMARERATPPAGSLHVHCTDVEGEWLAAFDPSAGDGLGYRFTREHAKGDAALRGPAAQVLLALYHREHDTEALTPVGDPAVLTAWLGAPGL